MRRFVGQLEHDPAVLPILMDKAKKAKSEALKIAPRKSKSGYASRFVILVAKGKVVLGNRDIAAHLIEFGSANNPAYAPLRRAALAIGVRLTDDH